MRSTLRTPSEPPESQPQERIIALVIFLVVVACLSPLRDYLSFNADEGIILSDADRILRGQIPYRDFFSLYTPGSYFLLALAFKIFGHSFVVARTILLAYCGIFSSLSYLLARRIASRTASLFATAMLAIGCLPIRFFVLHNWDSTLFALLALYSATQIMESGSRLWTGVLGLAAAMTCLTEQARGAGLLLGLAIAFVVIFPRLSDRRIHSAHAMMAAVGFFLPFAATFSYFASHHLVITIVRSWLYPVRGYYGNNHVPYGFVSTGAAVDFFSDPQGRVQPLVVLFGAPMFLVSALALIVIISTAYWVIRFYRSEEAMPDIRVLGGCIFVGIWLSTLATSRPDFSHILYITPLFMFLIPSLLDIDDSRVRTLSAARPIIAGVLLVSFIGLGFSVIARALGSSTHLQTRRGEVRAVGDDQVIPYVQEHLAEGQFMLVHPYQPLYSFLTGTTPPSRADGFQSSTPEAAQIVAEDLSRNTTQVVLLERTFAEKALVAWPTIPLGALAADPVAGYIMRNYRSCKVLNLNPPQTWIFDYMVRKDLPCPSEVSRPHPTL